MNLREKNEKYKMIILILFLVIGIGIGYATLGANLKINGVANIPSSTWNVHFKSGSITPTTGSVAIDTTQGEQAATIDNSTQVSYAVKLALPGDFYEFTVQVENTGSIDAMIDSVSSKLGTTEITTGTLPTYINYSVAYSDGTPIAAKQILAASGGTETIKVRIEFKTDIEANQLPGEAATLNLNFQVNYVQADNTAVAVPHPIDFSTASWDTIITAVQNGTTNGIEVGDTKTVDMGALGTHTLRVANNSTPAACATTGFSETACGFVLEFADVITTHNMNDTATNVGGWPATSMRNYINSDIYNALPSALKSAIIDTTVVSGHGYDDSTNFTSTDKLYLLSPMEVWGNNGFSVYDSARDLSRQLDYYNNLGIDDTNYSGAIKFDSSWWLRTAPSNSNGHFALVSSNGDYTSRNASMGYSLLPAFRIG